MSIEANAKCVYGYYTTTDGFKYMIDLAEYDNLFEWIDDYNRYNWCFWDEYNDYVYFGLPINYNTNPMNLQSEWEMFRLKILEKHINFIFLPEEIKKEGPHFQVFTIWD